MARALKICNQLFKGKEHIAVAKTFRTWDSVCVQMKAAEEKRRSEEQDKREKMAHALKICNHLFKGKENLAVSKTFRTWNHICTAEKIAKANAERERLSAEAGQEREKLSSDVSHLQASTIKDRELIRQQAMNLKKNRELIDQQAAALKKAERTLANELEQNRSGAAIHEKQHKEDMATISKLTQALAKVTEEARHATDEMAKLEAENDEIEKEKEELQDEYDDVLTKGYDLAEENKKLDEKLDEAEDEIHDLKTEVEVLKEAEIHFKAQIAELHAAANLDSPANTPR